MSQRFVYLIDADGNLNAHLVGELGRYGFRVEAAVDSNDLMQRKDDLPALIVLCIDPKRTGWAVCNRLRKSMTLKSTPLIITSAEATEKDFDDHKKLKTRAEEYLHKPFGVEALVDKIGGLIGMPDASAHEVLDLPLDGEEMAIEDHDAIIEEEHEVDSSLYGNAEPSTAMTSASFLEDAEDHTRIGVMNIDGEVDVETEAAFAAIGVDEPEQATDATVLPDDVRLSPRAIAASVKPGIAPAGNGRHFGGGGRAMEVPFDEPIGEDDPFSLPSSEPAPLPPAESQPIATRPPPREVSESIDLGLEDVARQAAQERPRPPSQPRLHARSESSVVSPLAPLSPGAATAGDTVSHDTGIAAVLELKRERDQLRRELDETQRRLQQKLDAPAAPTAAMGFSREREFLNLREIINKKEKEVLDLRDSLDGKERLILDGKDRLRELERKARDLDERVLGTERELVAAREKIEALGNDKERSVERERQVKARLDDALAKANRYEQEVESWRNKHAADLATADDRYNQTIESHQSALAELRDEQRRALENQEGLHAQRLQQTLDAHEEEKAVLGSKHDEDRGRLEAEHAAALEQLRETGRNERDGLKLRFEQTIAEMAETHGNTVRSLTDEHDNIVETLKSAHSAASTEKDQLHADEIAGLKARHIKDTKDVAARHQDEVGGLHEGYKAELRAAEERRQTEHQQKAEEHRGELEALAQDHVQERQRMEADHVAALHTLDERRQSELREAAEAHAGELERLQKEAEQKLADELKAARDQHMRKMQALEESHADLKTGMAQRHAQQLDEIKGQHAAAIAEYDAALAQRDTLITEGHTKINELEASVAEHESNGKLLAQRVVELEGRLKQVGDDLNARELTLNERAHRIAELEQESAGYQDQILKAYQRIKSDESIVSRAKKALAIALTLLDESAPDPGDEAKS